MKYAFSLIIIIATVFVMGCQESSTLEPAASPNQSFLKPTPNSGLVQLKGDVTLHSGGTLDQPFFHISGLTSYSWTIVGEGENQYYEFTIATQAQLIPSAPGLSQGTVSNQSIYQITTAGKQGVVLVQRDYYVPELQTKFHMLFAIAEDNSFSVQSMWLDGMPVTPIR